ncbi:bacillithiol biosynthesis cysteine-adding enzyme BshC [Cohnella faecalis]|uniref:bacillithiol biosynthesis cysteine-adding enzyme BshC n=1 Tax=Cohnella faecalis TaxID=2315694 RepID=UPI001313DFEC|nr:bacillithiol biosynthesis cysteine-adding enzyme BshC [Cohnella faecalis]
MIVNTLQGPVSPTLSERYREQDEAVVALFGKHPLQKEDWHARADELDRRSSSSQADRTALAEALRSFQSGMNEHPAVSRSLERLAEPGSLVVVGGQQAGLFGGALLIFYKAMTVVQTARHAEKLLGRPVVPVFWIAGEDHDFDEANHVNVQTQAGELRRVRLERPDGSRLAVSRTRLSPEAWEAALQELETELPDSEFKPALIDRLRSHVTDAPTLSLAFARLLSEWFGPEGMLLLDADDAGLRALEGPMFRELIERNDKLEEALKAGEKKVASLGFSLQAETAFGSANLFLHHDSGRLLLHKEPNGNFADRRRSVSLCRDDMLSLTEDSPERLSTNALTRPLMQDYVLPVLAAVLGPAELAYWGILGPAFAEFGLEMPLLVPRQSFVYVETGIARQLDKFALTPEEALWNWERRKEQWLASQDEWRLEEKFRNAKEQFLAIYRPVMETVAALQPGLAKLSESNRDKIVEQISFLENRSMDALAKQHEASLRQWDRIRTALMPGSKPQERVFGTIHFWNRYGPEWLTRWAEVPYEPNGGFRLIEG